MNQTYEISLISVMVFSGLTVGVLWCFAHLAGITKPAKPKPQPVSASDRALMRDICTRLTTDFASLLEMPLRPEDREVLLEHKREYEMTMSTFNVNNGEQYDQVMVQINTHRRWVGSFKDRLLKQSVPIPSFYHDYNR